MATSIRCRSCIRKGAGSTCTPVNLNACRVVDFFYEQRSDVSTSYRNDAKMVNDQRLQRAEVRLGGQLVRKYTLGYLMSATPARGYASVPQLASVTETGADGIMTLPATTFVYNVDANGANLALTQISMASPPAEGLTGCTYPIDIK